MFIFATLSLTAAVEAHIREQLRREAALLYWTFELLGTVTRTAKFFFIAFIVVVAFFLHVFETQFPPDSAQYAEVIHITTWAIIWTFGIGGTASICQRQCWQKIEPLVRRAAQTFAV